MTPPSNVPHSNVSLQNDPFGYRQVPQPPSMNRPVIASTTPTVAPTPTRRGQGFALLCLLLAVLVAIGLFVSVFLVFDTVDVASVDPVGVAQAWLTVFGLLVVLAVAVIVMSVVAVVRARPRGRAVAALLCSIVLPVLAVAIAIQFGLSALKTNAAEAVGADPDTIAGVIETLESYGIPTGSLRELLPPPPR